MKDRSQRDQRKKPQTKTLAKKRTKEKRGRRHRGFEDQTWQLPGREIGLGAAEETSTPPCPQAVLRTQNQALGKKTCI